MAERGRYTRERGEPDYGDYRPPYEVSSAQGLLRPACFEALSTVALPFLSSGRMPIIKGSTIPLHHRHIKKIIRIKGEAVGTPITTPTGNSLTRIPTILTRRPIIALMTIIMTMTTDTEKRGHPHHRPDEDRDTRRQRTMIPRSEVPDRRKTTITTTTSPEIHALLLYRPSLSSTNSPAKDAIILISNPVFLLHFCPLVFPVFSFLPSQQRHFSI